MLSTVHNLVVVLLNITQSVQGEHAGHHALDGVNDDVEKMQFFCHSKGQLLVAEQLYRNMDDPERKNKYLVLTGCRRLRISWKGN